MLQWFSLHSCQWTISSSLSHLVARGCYWCTISEQPAATLFPSAKSIRIEVNERDCHEEKFWSILNILQKLTHSPAQYSVLNPTMVWQLVLTSRCQDKFSKRGHQPVLGHQVNSRDCRTCHWNFGCWEVWALLWKFWSHDLHFTKSIGKSLWGMEKKSGNIRNFTKFWGKKWLTVPVDIYALGLLRFFWPELNFGLWYLWVFMAWAWRMVKVKGRVKGVWVKRETEDGN